MKILKTTLILFIVIGTLISCIEEKNKIEIIDDETFIADEDNENLKLAVLEAQTNLNYFIEKLRKHSKDTNYWFKALEFKKNDSLIGEIINEPSWSNTLKIGDTINVHRKDIEDWYIENEIDELIEGDFTEKILFGEKE